VSSTYSPFEPLLLFSTSRALVSCLRTRAVAFPFFSPLRCSRTFLLFAEWVPLFRPSGYSPPPPTSFRGEFRAFFFSQARRTGIALFSPFCPGPCQRPPFTSSVFSTRHPARCVPLCSISDPPFSCGFKFSCSSLPLFSQASPMNALQLRHGLSPFCPFFHPLSHRLPRSSLSP